MTEWTSISVTEEQKEKLESEKPDGMAMGAFLVSAIESNSEPELHVDHELADQIKEDLEKQTDVYEAKEEILNRLDDLQSQLPNDVAGELR